MPPARSWSACLAQLLDESVWPSWHLQTSTNHTKPIPYQPYHSLSVWNNWFHKRFKRPIPRGRSCSPKTLEEFGRIIFMGESGFIDAKQQRLAWVVERLQLDKGCYFKHQDDQDASNLKCGRVIIDINKYTILNWLTLTNNSSIIFNTHHKAIRPRTQGFARIHVSMSKRTTWSKEDPDTLATASNLGLALLEQDQNESRSRKSSWEI